MFRLTPKGLVLVEIVPGVSLERAVLAKIEFRPLISEELKWMDPRIFRDEPNEHFH